MHITQHQVKHHTPEVCATKTRREGETSPLLSRVVLTLKTNRAHCSKRWVHLRFFSEPHTLTEENSYTVLPQINFLFLTLLCLQATSDFRVFFLESVVDQCKDYSSWTWLMLILFFFLIFLLTFHSWPLGTRFCHWSRSSQDYWCRRWSSRPVHHNWNRRRA